MIDLKLLQENPELFKVNNKRRGVDVDVDEAVVLIGKRAEAIKKLEEVRKTSNEVAKKMARASEDERPGLIEQGKTAKEEVKVLEGELARLEGELDEMLAKFPNVLREDVPNGEDETSNQVVRAYGEATKFNFEPKDHMEIGEALGLIDAERAAKVSGSRFVYLKGDAVLLQFALVQYVMGIAAKHGFEPIVVPHMIAREAMGAMGYLAHGGEDEVYHLKNDDLVLIGTSEQAIGPMYMGEAIEESELPRRHVGYSPCYRREAGSYGKDVRGILRLHQFDKIEMFSFTEPDKSDEEHEKILAIQEEVMQGLELPHRVVKLCAGDTGTSSARTYDIETWMPAQNVYRETHSTSNTTDYQTRALDIRVKREGKNEMAHALNGTGLAIGRGLIAILENYQNEDGSVTIPEVLRSYMGGKEKIERR